MKYLKEKKDVRSLFRKSHDRDFDRIEEFEMQCKDAKPILNYSLNPYMSTTGLEPLTLRREGNTEYY